jgi:MoxR-like ATPase
MTTNTLERFHTLETALNEELYERREAIHTAILAIVAKKHHFQIGPPGVAKSLLVSRLVKRIGDMRPADYFHWLLTMYTTPEELYGAVDLPLYKNTGVFRRLTADKLPVASFVFLDEIFKGNSAILNANLTAMNERKFMNNDRENEDIPLISLFAASNEMPPGDETNALWDRVHFRIRVQEMQETSSFINMLTKPMDPNPEKIITLEDVFAAHEMVDRIVVPNDVLDNLRGLREDMKEEGLIVSDRRWNECYKIIQAEAYLNEREIAETDDMRPLMHVLWSREEDTKKVTRMVLDLANPIDRKALDIYDHLNELEINFRRDMADADNEKDKSKFAIEVHSKLKKTRKELIELKKQSEETGRASDSLADVKKRFTAVAKLLSTEGFDSEGEARFSLDG